MIYNNPIINSDYSDPDVIKYKGSYYLVSSSFSDTTGVPILKSKNLVDWKILRYVYSNLPFAEFDNVRHGEGAWAPSIRYHNGIFYIIVPMYGKGIYVYQTDDIENGEFKFNKLIDNPGVIDPCPIWTNDNKCYLVCGFAKSKCGFNSVLGLYEVS
jgi:beta-xylosidase